MQLKSFLLPLPLLAFLLAFPASSHSQTLITFDDLAISTGGIYLASITNGYEGFNWANFYIANALIEANRFGTNGNYYGMVSASNTAFNGFGTTAEIDSPVNFNFLSAYLTGAWNSNLNIEVQGFNGTNLLYDQTVIASAINPMLANFDYRGVDRLTFTSFGGQSAGFPNGGGEQFAMDNFTFEFVPEPSPLLLTGLAALLLWPILKRSRA